MASGSPTPQFLKSLREEIERREMKYRALGGGHAGGMMSDAAATLERQIRQLQSLRDLLETDALEQGGEMLSVIDNAINQQADKLCASARKQRRLAASLLVLASLIAGFLISYIGTARPFWH